MAVLLVVAHPDDEVLGCGSTAAMFARNGIPVRACILSGEVNARRARPPVPELREDIRRASQLLNLCPPIVGSFPNIEFNIVPHLELVQFIEEAVASTGSDMIFTHHPGDVNSDHRHTSLACQAAARLFQRRSGVNPLRALYYMEILSSTDWSFPSDGRPFQADTFFPAGETLDCKLAALNAYRGVMREFPHPRSEEIVRGIAAYRGGQAGMDYAEAFQTAFHAYRTVEAMAAGLSDMYDRAGKRLFDMVFAVAALAMLWPVMLLVAVAIRLEDGGPSLFRQKRVGRRGIRFTFYKFRSMPVNSANVPSHLAGKLKVTRVGRVIRRTNLDELPQLFNILRGEMSLVGPRPALPQQDDICRLRRKSGADRCVPGLTGLAQVNSFTGMSPEQKVVWDACYSRRLTLFGDLAILLRTVGYLMKPPPAY